MATGRKDAGPADIQITRTKNLAVAIDNAMIWGRSHTGRAHMVKASTSLAIGHTGHASSFVEKPIRQAKTAGLGIREVTAKLQDGVPDGRLVDIKQLPIKGNLAHAQSIEIIGQQHAAIEIWSLLCADADHAIELIGGLLFNLMRKPALVVLETLIDIVNEVQGDIAAA